MNKTTFYTLTILGVLVISMITSIFTINVREAVMLAPFGTEKEGQVQIGDSGGEVNIIIIDDQVALSGGLPNTGQVTDKIFFQDVRLQSTRTTCFNTDPMNPDPQCQKSVNEKPFVIRNEGNVQSDVRVYATSTPLFSITSGLDPSLLQFWVEETDPCYDPIDSDGMGGCISGPQILDDCAGHGPCFSSTPCTDIANACDIPFISDISQSGINPPIAINGLNYESDKDEAYLHIKIYISGEEPAGTKETKIVVIGSQTGLSGYCGDGTCDTAAGEDCGGPNECEIDCGPCSTCGDGICDTGEECFGPNECPVDCNGGTPC